MRASPPFGARCAGKLPPLSPPTSPSPPPPEPVLLERVCRRLCHAAAGRRDVRPHRRHLVATARAAAQYCHHGRADGEGGKGLEWAEGMARGWTGRAREGAGLDLGNPLVPSLPFPSVVPVITFCPDEEEVGLTIRASQCTCFQNRIHWADVGARRFSLAASPHHLG